MHGLRGQNLAVLTLGLSFVLSFPSSLDLGLGPGRGVLMVAGSHLFMLHHPHHDAIGRCPSNPVSRTRKVSSEPSSDVPGAPVPEVAAVRSESQQAGAPLGAELPQSGRARMRWPTVLTLLICQRLLYPRLWLGQPLGMPQGRLGTWTWRWILRDWLSG